jgi:hypothetical protein
LPGDLLVALVHEDIGVTALALNQGPLPIRSRAWVG